MKKQHWLYVLKLKQDKYYVGMTSRKYPADRIREHINGFYTAQWVRKYGFEELVDIVNLGEVTKEEAQKLEQNLTVDYMDKYGHQNVRGGKLNYSGKYLRIGNYFWRDYDVSTFKAVMTLLAIIFALGILYYLK